MSFIGEVRDTPEMDVANVNVSYPDSKSGSFTFDAPKGTAILAHRAVERSRGGRVSYSFSAVVGDNSVFVSAQDVRSSFQAIYDHLQKNSSKENNKQKEKEYKERIELLLKEAIRIATMTASTNAKVTCNWECKHDGSEFDRKGGNLSLALVVTLIQSLDKTNIDQLVLAIISAIEKGTPPAQINLAA
jgi:hypothetical protein